MSKINWEEDSKSFVSNKEKEISLRGLNSFPDTSEEEIISSLAISHILRNLQSDLIIKHPIFDFKIVLNLSLIHI